MKMRFFLTLTVLILTIAGISLSTQAMGNSKGNRDLATGCYVVPKYQCAFENEDGGIEAWFGYRAVCPRGSEVTDLFVEVGANNKFVPGAAERGQPNIFAIGNFSHEPLFQVEFSADEVSEMRDEPDNLNTFWQVTGFQTKVNPDRLCTVEEF